MVKKKVDRANPFAPRTEQEKEFMTMIWKDLEEAWKKRKNSH